MTPDEQRKAIAEACGWTRLREGKLTGGLVGQPPGGRIEDFGTAPDYLNDLNAIADAMLSLKPIEYFSFSGKLERIVARDNSAASTHFFIFDATAAQRAEAFLKTIGKWRDE